LVLIAVFVFEELRSARATAFLTDLAALGLYTFAMFGAARHEQ
jgi:EamA domain-containing membrane protein RarD